MDRRTSTWTEADSRDFLDLAEVAVPSRREQIDALLSLIPAEHEETFSFVDLCCGEALLATQVLDRFPGAQLLGLDGSALMLEKAAAQVVPYDARACIKRFDLDKFDWIGEMPSPLRCILSSLALHHLDEINKKRLFRALAERLEPGGALLIADIIAGQNGAVRRSFSAAWDTLARQRSLALTQSLTTYERAVREGWTPRWIAEPETGELPYTVFEQLKWLEEAGFSTVDCFWMRAGHAIYGGYR